MKLSACVLLAIALSGLLAAPVSNMQTIRRYEQGGVIITVERLEDGPNTCYIASTFHQWQSVNVMSSISCVKR